MPGEKAIRITTKFITIYMIVSFVTLSSCDKDQGTITYSGNGKTGRTGPIDNTHSAVAASECVDADYDTYGDNCSAGQDCNDNDFFYNEICPTCTVQIIPKILGWLIGDKNQTRTLLIVGERGTEFDNKTVIKWESDAIEVVSTRVFLKRFMLMRATFNGAALEKEEYRVLVGHCEGKVKWAFNNAQHCITSKCLDEIVACTGDTECNSWLSCIMECGDDKMLCPTICGTYYQSPNINAFTQCGLDNGCIRLDFSSLPQCKVPETKPIDVGNIDGIWWNAGIKGYDYVIFNDCQRYAFKELSDTEISVENSLPITRAGETRICKNLGKFTKTTDGVMKLVYDNYTGYYELYYAVHQTPNVIVMHVCSADSENSIHDYGTLVFTRVSLASLDSSELAALESALQNTLHIGLGDITLLKTTDCPNQ